MLSYGRFHKERCCVPRLGGSNITFSDLFNYKDLFCCCQNSFPPASCMVHIANGPGASGGFRERPDQVMLSLLSQSLVLTYAFLLHLLIVLRHFQLAIFTLFLFISDLLTTFPVKSSRVRCTALEVPKHVFLLQSSTHCHCRRRCTSRRRDWLCFYLASVREIANTSLGTVND